MTDPLHSIADYQEALANILRELTWLLLFIADERAAREQMHGLLTGAASILRMIDQAAAQ